MNRQSLRDGYEFGTRILFDIPNNAPNICSECEKPNGNCGVGLRCICHPKECSKFHCDYLKNLKFFSLDTFVLSTNNMTICWSFIAEDKVI